MLARAFPLPQPLFCAAGVPQIAHTQARRQCTGCDITQGEGLELLEEVVTPHTPVHNGEESHLKVELLI